MGLFILDEWRFHFSPNQVLGELHVAPVIPVSVIPGKADLSSRRSLRGKKCTSPVAHVLSAAGSK